LEELEMDWVGRTMLSEPTESAVDAILVSLISIIFCQLFRGSELFLTIDVPLFKPRTVISRAGPSRTPSSTPFARALVPILRWLATIVRFRITSFLGKLMVNCLAAVELVVNGLATLK
jgi:hypothetical protein